MTFKVASDVSIPHFSKSIITSRGEIYLIGGSLQ